MLGEHSPNYQKLSRHVFLIGVTDAHGPSPQQTTCSPLTATGSHQKFQECCLKPGSRFYLRKHHAAAEFESPHLGSLEHGRAHHGVANETGPQVVRIIVGLNEKVIDIQVETQAKSHCSCI